MTGLGISHCITDPQPWEGLSPWHEGCRTAALVGLASLTSGMSFRTGTLGALPQDPRLSSLPAVMSFQAIALFLAIEKLIFPSLLAVMSFRTVLPLIAKLFPLRRC